MIEESKNEPNTRKVCNVTAWIHAVIGNSATHPTPHDDEDQAWWEKLYEGTDFIDDVNGYRELNKKLVMEARKKFLAGGVLMGATTLAYCYGGTAGAMQVYSITRGYLPAAQQRRLPDMAFCPDNRSHGDAAQYGGRYSGVVNAGLAQTGQLQNAWRPIANNLAPRSVPERNQQQLQLYYPTSSLDGS